MHHPTHHIVHETSGGALAEMRNGSVDASRADDLQLNYHKIDELTLDEKINNNNTIYIFFNNNHLLC